jgi:hypothetical protein
MKMQIKQFLFFFTVIFKDIYQGINMSLPPNFTPTFFAGPVPPFCLKVTCDNPVQTTLNRWTARLSTTGQLIYEAATQYDPSYIKVGQWFSNTVGGYAWQVVEISFQNTFYADVTLEDVEYFNESYFPSDPVQGPLNGFIGYVFNLNLQGVPTLTLIDPSDLPSLTFVTDLQGSFAARNRNINYVRVYQPNHGFSVGEFVYMDSAGLFQLSTSSSSTVYQTLGVVTSLGFPYTANGLTPAPVPNPDYFCFQPYGVYYPYYDAPFTTADPAGTIYYLSGTGSLTNVQPTSNDYAAYIKISASGDLILLSKSYGASSSATGPGIQGEGDTLYIEGNLNVAGMLSVDQVTGLVQIPNDLVVNGTLYANEIAYGDVVKIGDDITFTTSDGAVTAIIGDFQQLKVHEDAKFYGDVIIKGTVEASTGVFNNLVTEELLVHQSASFSGPVSFGGDVTIQGVLDATTGVFDNLVTDQLTVLQTATFSGPVTFNATVDASGQTGIFGTIIADNIIGPFPSSSGPFENLTVNNNLYLGNELLPIETGADDTIYINGNVNVSDVVSINRVDGTTQIANDLIVFGTITANTFDFNNYLAVGENIVLDSSSNTISVGSLTLTSTYFATGAALIYDTRSASRGQVIVPNGYQSVIVLSSQANRSSFIQAVVCSDNTSQIVQRVIPLPGAFKIVMSGTIGDITVNWMIVN